MENNLLLEVDEILEENMANKYAKTTYGRAIPSCYDGLIEVTRKLLFNIYNKGYYGSQATYKSASIVGDVMAKLHPHGDTAIYGNLVQITQWFSTNYPYVAATTNFGTILGDTAGHYRYTDCRGSKFAADVIFKDISPKNVDYQSNFDRTMMEPIYLPTRLPLLLLNGAFSGIAVGFAVNIPPHNLSDICDICIKYIKNPNISLEKLVDGFFPDYPTGGIIINKDAIEKFYKYGEKTSIKIEADVEIDREKNIIIIKSLPYKVYWNTITSKIIELTNGKLGKPNPILSKIKGFKQKKVRTENENDSYYEFTIEVHKDANILEVLDQVMKHTSLSTTYPMTYIMNFDGKVKDVNIKDIIANWYSVRKDVFKRKYISRKNELEIQNHNLEGLISIYPRLHELIDFVTNSTLSKDELTEEIYKNFKPLSRSQSLAIINMHLHELTKISKQKLIDSLEANKKEIEEINSILTDIDGEIIKDIEYLKSKYSRERRTKLINKDEVKIDSINISSGAILYSKNSFGIFNIVELINSKNITNGMKSVKIDGKNYKKIIGSSLIDKALKAVIVFYENGVAKRINVSDIKHLNVWFEIIKEDEPFIKSVIPVFDEEDKVLIVSDDNKLRIVKLNEFTTSKRNIGKFNLVKYIKGNMNELLLMDEESGYLIIDDYMNEIPIINAKSSGVKTNFEKPILHALEVPDNDNFNIVIELVVNNEGIYKPSSIYNISNYKLHNRGSRIRKPRKYIKDLVLDNGKISFVGSVDISNKNSKIILLNSDGISKLDIKNFKLENKMIFSEIIGLMEEK